MQQDIFFKQQELSQSYQLGLLENEYVINPKKYLTNFGLFMAIAILVPLIMYSISPRATNSVNILISNLIFFLIFVLVVGCGIILGLYRYYRHLHIYVYTYGLVCLNGNRSRVVYWQQIKRTYTNRGYLNISLKNETAISIPTYISRYSELRDRIKQGIANARNEG